MIHIVNALLSGLFTFLLACALASIPLHSELRMIVRGHLLRRGSQVRVISKHGELSRDAFHVAEPEWFEGKVGTITGLPEDDERYGWTYEVMFWDLPDTRWNIFISDLRLVKR